MKKNGFTLIELLAVIIILAIIALIAVPTVLNLIEKTNEKTVKITAENYRESLQNFISVAGLKGLDLNGEMIVSVNEVNQLLKQTNSIKGELPTDGWLLINNNMVTWYSLLINGYVVSYAGDEITTKKGGTIVDPEIFSIIFNDGDSVLFNPNVGDVCSYSDYVSNSSDKDGCLKWYAFDDTKGKTSVKLLLSEPTSYDIPWVSKDDYVLAGGNVSDYGENGNNTKGPVTALKQLKSDTQNWKQELEPRLITADEVNGIISRVQVSYFDQNSNNVSFISNNVYTYKVQPISCLGANLWISTGVADDITKAYIWKKGCSNDFPDSMETEYVNAGGDIRPVITVPKTAELFYSYEK